MKTWRKPKTNIINIFWVNSIIFQIDLINVLSISVHTATCPCFTTNFCIIIMIIMLCTAQIICVLWHPQLGHHRHRVHRVRVARGRRVGSVRVHCFPTKISHLSTKIKIWYGKNSWPAINMVDQNNCSNRLLFFLFCFEKQKPYKTNYKNRKYYYAFSKTCIKNLHC